MLRQSAIGAMGLCAALAAGEASAIDLEFLGNDYGTLDGRIRARHVPDR